MAMTQRLYPLVREGRLPHLDLKENLENLWLALYDNHR
jgi:hypothetical protein